MGEPSHAEPRRVQIRRHTLMLVMAWTAVIGALLGWARYQADGQVKLTAAAEATGYTVIWLLGVVGIGAGGRHIGRRASDRDRAERELRESERRLKQIAETIEDVFWITDWESHRTLFASPAFEKIWGRPLQSLYHNREEWADAIHPEDRQRAWEAFVSLEEQATYDEEYRIVHPDGSVRWIRDRGYPVRDDDGLLHRVVGIAQDITERKQTRRQLNFLWSAVEQSSEGVALVDLEGALLYINKSFARLHGYTPEELLGVPLSIFHTAEQLPEVTSALQQIQETGEFAGEIWHTRRDGSVFPTWMHNSLVRDASGKPTAMLGTLRDITDLKQAERELADHRDHLEELVEQRSRQLEESRAHVRRSERLASLGTLAAGIAHEINNPLGLILMGAQRALEESENTDLVQESLQRITEDVRRCSRIVKSILRFSHERPSDSWPLDPGNAVRNAEDFTREYARSHGIRVEVECPRDLPTVLGNEIELEQVIVNLVHNAIHASRKGQTVWLGAQKTSVGVRIAIVDQGKGMDAEDVSRAFDPFYTMRQSEGGTGLGLSICHGIVTDMGGAIDISSQPDQGTSISVELPAHKPGRGEE